MIRSGSDGQGPEDVVEELLKGRRSGDEKIVRCVLTTQVGRMFSSKMHYNKRTSLR